MTDRAHPFENDVVFDPREAELPVPGLNDRALAILLRRFTRLEAEPHPRRYRMNMKAQLLLAADPGYGKTHLIGRLFRGVHGRATQIYLRPFQEPGSAWRSILAKVVQELDRPDDPAISVRRSVRPTQLDTFAEGVIGYLLAELIEKEIVGGDYGPDLVRELRVNPDAAFSQEGEHFLRDWMRDQSDFLVSLFVEELSALDIPLHAPATAWLSTLTAYCFGEGGKEQREACLEWFKGGDTPAGAKTSEPPVAGDSRGRNAAAFARLQDFLVLAGLCKPFVLCFDQIELMADNPELAAEFGVVVDELVTFGLNHMVVVTANIEPWKSVMEKKFQTAFRDRFSDPITLEPIRQSQALELARRRLAGVGRTDAEIARFCDPEWMENIFLDKERPLAARDFIRLCAKRLEEMGGFPQ
jgi:hypothetical protein